MKIAIFVFTISLVFTFNKAFSQDTIHWSPCYKLKWEDFQGTPDTTSKFKAVSAASINYTLTNDEKSFSYNVICVFYKKKSWSKSKSGNLLRHEQGHFDLAELFARKLRQAFKNYKFNNPATIQNDFKQIAKDIRSERDKVNTMYDKETNFSINKEKQVYWSKRIAKELLK
ncbi:MAG: DUF922 domain-containing protein [Chitinophagaceae bacterium]|nr:DUF922 domain-containing protein [Chitinophagaceae bacterium]